MDFVSFLWMCASLVLGWVVSASVLRFAVRITGDEPPAFPYAMVVALVAPLASMVVTIPLGLTLGCVLSMVSTVASTVLLTGIGVVVQGAVIKGMLDTTLGRGLAVAVLHTVMMSVVTVPLAWVSGLI